MILDGAYANERFTQENDEPENLCEVCGEVPGTHMQSGESVTPTDRGMLREYEERWVCDECDPERP